jgi:putative endonuclease
MVSYLYILRCSDGSYYTDITSDLVARVSEHIEGINPESYTYKRRPVKLVYYETFPNQEAAFKRRLELNRLSRRKKAELVSSSRSFSQIP